MSVPFAGSGLSLCCDLNVVDGRGWCQLGWRIFFRTSLDLLRCARTGTVPEGKYVHLKVWNESGDSRGIVTTLERPSPAEERERFFHYVYPVSNVRSMGQLAWSNVPDLVF